MDPQYKTMLIFWKADQFETLQIVMEQGTTSELLDEDLQKTGCTHPTSQQVN